MSLYDALLRYDKENIYAFHMPGHKRNREFLKKYLSLDFAGLDMTELNDTDNLLSPCGEILETQKAFALRYGADESFLLINGSTVGILASVLFVLNGSKEALSADSLSQDSDDESFILAARNSHKSFFSALALSGGSARYVYPRRLGELPGGIAAEDLEEVLKQSGERCKAVFVTSPTYEGIVSDLEAIVRLAHERNIPVLVDEAHGAHFPYSKLFPKGALHCGADLVIQSQHKTLPLPGQCGTLHVQGTLIDQEKLKAYLTMLQTSSPSYFFMGMMDRWIHAEMEQPFRNYCLRLTEFRQEMEKLRTLRLLSKEMISASPSNNHDKGSAVFDLDLGKLVFHSKGIRGQYLESLLRKNYGIQMEYARGSMVLGMTSVADTKEGFARLKKAIMELDELCENELNHNEVQRIPTHLNEEHNQKPPKTRLKISQAMQQPKERVFLNEAEHRIAAGFVVPYPPGIPLLVPGEEINSEVIEQLKRESTVLGIHEGMIDVSKPYI